MNRWLRRIRGALGMGLTWALVWGPVAVLIGMAVDPDGSMDEMWVAIGAYPGFLGGVVFSAVLAIAARRRGLDDLPLSRVAIWGAAAGLLVGTLPFLIGEPTSDRPVWVLAAIVISSITLLSAASAAGSLALARMADRRDPLDGEARINRSRQHPLIHRSGQDSPAAGAEAGLPERVRREFADGSAGRTRGLVPAVEARR
ncbi:hypothetical protein HNQ61_003956 [Longimicrobium terrae]|uniref:Uncharacterized protein n=2 Tax=Longimicrobium terrae TaxID=1639882 RepID=A0A841H2S6_9BACT|nr:hypothetical protein [Longimicrobium terrae]MBB6072294.1 hypothetical protein [Longimicrobium terrae]